MARRSGRDGSRPGPRPGLAPVPRPRLYESLAAHIADFIEAQGLGPGDRLPPERELAADLGVSRATLSRALAAMETQGRIEVRHGVGALVSDGAGTGLSGLLRDRPGSEVVAAREAVLAGIARAAAARPDRTLRIALVGDDGRAVGFDDLWRCLRRLAEKELLSSLDDALAPLAPPPPDDPELLDRLRTLARAVVAGEPSSAAVACHGLLDRVPEGSPAGRVLPAQPALGEPGLDL